MLMQAFLFLSCCISERNLWGMVVLVVDYLQDRAKGSILYGFRGGPAGIMKCKYVELTADYIYPYRSQVIFPRKVNVRRRRKFSN